MKYFFQHENKNLVTQHSHVVSFDNYFSSYHLKVCTVYLDLSWGIFQGFYGFSLFIYLFYLFSGSKWGSNERTRGPSEVSPLDSSKNLLDGRRHVTDNQVDAYNYSHHLLSHEKCFLLYWPCFLNQCLRNKHHKPSSVSCFNLKKKIQ